MRSSNILCFLSIMWCSILSASADTGPDDCIGVWETGNRKAHVEIYRKSGRYFGRIVWLREPNDPLTGRPKLDGKNSSTGKRNRPVSGIHLLRSLHWDEQSRVWEDGYIYDPEAGKDYACIITMADDNTLHVRGYIMAPAFGRTDVWKRKTAN